MNNLRHRLSIDGGQTGIRLRLTEEVSDPRRENSHNSSLSSSSSSSPAAARALSVEDGPGVLTDRSVIEQVAERVLTFAAHSEQRIDELAVGLSGLTPEGARAGELLERTRGAGVTRVALAHDSVTGYLAANGTDSGVVLAIGTGSVTLAASPTATAKVDGWGYLLGDAGSGYWLGRAGLDAVMRAYDGRGPFTRLSAPAVELFGPQEEMYMRLQSDVRRVSAIASFARTVVETAADGDEVADRICVDAAAELALSGASALARSGWAPGAPARASWVGSLLTHSEVLRRHVDEQLAARTGGLVLQAPYGGPLDGVSTLLDVAGGHPLHALIHTAGEASTNPVR